jgi:peptidoglycan hydrolase-like protein with peptidoglycan-binding domain
VPSLAIRNGFPRASFGAGEGAPGWWMLRRRGWRYRDIGGVVLAAIAAGAIVVNALFLQSGPHPAPIFAGELAPAAETKDAVVGALPRPREAAPAKSGSAKSGSAKSEPAKFEPAKPEPAKSEPAVRKAEPGKAEPSTPVELLAEVQRELARRAFYDGAIDGLHGSRTDTAIREFERAAGLKASTEPNAALLRAIRSSNVKAAKAATTGANAAGRPTPPAPVPVQPARSDPINEALAPSKRVAAVQRALADYGYGQIRPTGVLDRETKTAIERFERARKLPVSGAVSERLARELATVTGRPLE